MIYVVTWYEILKDLFVPPLLAVRYSHLASSGNLDLLTSHLFTNPKLLSYNFSERLNSFWKKKIQGFIPSLESPRMLQVWLSRSDSDNFQRTILNWPLMCPDSPHSLTVFCHSGLTADQVYWWKHMAGYKLTSSSFDSAENNTIF